MLTINSGFAGMTPLHEAVLFQSPDMLRHWCNRSEKDEKNFLGQTPLHLAVSKLEHLNLLLDAGHDANAIDADGITPLMYAAALNQVGAVQMLLSAGASPSIRDIPKLDYTFVLPAALRDNWQLIIIALRQIKVAMGEAIADALAREALTCHFVMKYFDSRKQNVPYGQVLPYCRSLHFSITDPYNKTKGNTLLHFARSARDIDILLGHGFEKMNHQNSDGSYALMTVAHSPHFSSSEVIARLLDGGADANLQDNKGHTTIHHLIRQLRYYTKEKQ
ncbi:hypothetical protein NM208_g11187 [Fusarium decemcellulare]|uniref:Uncharacterized protein n=1 Tax=Fusarium decemcellulare TaxID=57161 RepID=A0ACC1RV84_9HYPO|nr:hypothetical protein NM208_g11187 [Fusarium decemcellulare]